MQNKEQKNKCLYIDHSPVWGGDGFFCQSCFIEFIPKINEVENPCKGGINIPSPEEVKVEKNSENQVKTLIADCKKKGIKLISADVECKGVNRLEKLGVNLGYPRTLCSEALAGDDFLAFNNAFSNAAQKMYNMGINIEFNPDLALRTCEEYEIGQRKKEECIPKDWASNDKNLSNQIGPQRRHLSSILKILF